MSKQTSYTSSNCKDKVWNLAKPIKNKDPSKFRKDPYGDQICKNSYGKRTEQGWEIDHIKPQSKGGSNTIRNLQALKSTTNNKKSDSLVKKSRHSQK